MRLGGLQAADGVVLEPRLVEPRLVGRVDEVLVVSAVRHEGHGRRPRQSSASGRRRRGRRRHEAERGELGVALVLPPPLPERNAQRLAKVTHALRDLRDALPLVGGRAMDPAVAADGDAVELADALPEVDGQVLAIDRLVHHMQPELRGFQRLAVRSRRDVDEVGLWLLGAVDEELQQLHPAPRRLRVHRAVMLPELDGAARLGRGAGMPSVDEVGHVKLVVAVHLRLRGDLATVAILARVGVGRVDHLHERAGGVCCLDPGEHVRK
mmetsp:Transcript_67721/g.202379  ORF Transcript_67721/g.202379 Transcript_67721/m.202379 type:complete len:267 (+) Transcript_67721:409-1209(+)